MSKCATNLLTRARNSLEQFLETHEIQVCEKSNQLLSEVINTLIKLFTDWCSEGRILPFGSYKLGVHSPDSDLDLLCVAPQRYSRHEFQTEFLSRLQSSSDITYCQGIFRAKVPLIKLIISKIKVDLLYANTDQDLNSIRPEGLDEASLLGLNGWKNNELILSLVPNSESFRQLLKVVRFWAKKRGIYSGILGFLGGAAWSILCAKICILYPSLSDIELLQKFFKVYSLWDWTIAICLNPDQNTFVYNSHQAYMNILTPAYPSYNAAYSLIASGFNCIIQELVLGYKVVKDVIEGNQEWQTLFEELDFFQQFKHFVSVTIYACSHDEYETWSGLVFSRIKFLIQELECIYPRPAIMMYHKPFAVNHKVFKVSFEFFIGLNFNFPHTLKVDMRRQFYNFCAILKEIRPNKDATSLRVKFVARKDLTTTKAKLILKS